MYKRLIAATAAMIASSAGAVTFTYQPGSSVYAGPTPTYDFESAVPITGGLLASDSVSGVRAQPFGSSGNYYSVSPADGTPALLDLSAFDLITSLSLLWGSIDSYNTIEFLDGSAGILGSFTGTQIYAAADGDQSDPFTNPIVTFQFSAAEAAALNAVRFLSTENAFEFDNITISATAVPEPATWALMLAGFGAVGYTLRTRRRRTHLQAV